MLEILQRLSREEIYSSKMEDFTLMSAFILMKLFQLNGLDKETALNPRHIHQDLAPFDFFWWIHLHLSKAIFLYNLIRIQGEKKKDFSVCWIQRLNNSRIHFLRADSEVYF